MTTKEELDAIKKEKDVFYHLDGNLNYNGNDIPFQGIILVDPEGDIKGGFARDYDGFLNEKSTLTGNFDIYTKTKVVALFLTKNREDTYAESILVSKRGDIESRYEGEFDGVFVPPPKPETGSWVAKITVTKGYQELPKMEGDKEEDTTKPEESEAKKEGSE